MFAQHDLLEMFSLETREPLVDTYIKSREQRAAVNNHPAAMTPVQARALFPRLPQYTLSPSYQAYFVIGPEIVDSSPVQRWC